MRTVLLMVPALLLLALVAYGAITVWNSVPGGQMTVQGYVALCIGVVVTLLLAAVLIRLLLLHRPEDEPPDRR